MTVRSGIGFDVHPLVQGRALVLGGITIPFEKGLAGHSDGDALIHASDRRNTGRGRARRHRNALPAGRRQIQGCCQW